MTTPPKTSYGSMAHVMRDNLYVMKPGHLFTSPAVTSSFTLRFYAVLLINANGQNLSVTTDDQTLRAPVIAIKPPERRTLVAMDAQLVSVLINPLHEVFPRFRLIAEKGGLSIPFDAFRPLQSKMQAAYRGEIEMPEARELYEKLIGAAAPFLPELQPVSPRVRDAIARWAIDAEQPIGELAKDVGVSTSRMTHLFTQVMGLPMRSYQLWRKVHRIASLFADGASLTEIAYAAGFADASHMGSTFQETFGAPPSHFLRSDLVRVSSERAPTGNKPRS